MAQLRKHKFILLNLIGIFCRASYVNLLFVITLKIAFLFRVLELGIHQSQQIKGRARTEGSGHHRDRRLRGIELILNIFR